jgi:3-oxoacyl-[acyl-carrier-protein] synthase-1
MASQARLKSAICIVGVGAKTPVGITAPAAAVAVRAGIPGFGEHPYAIDRRGEPMVVARVPHVSDDQSGVDRFLSLAIEPAREALIPLTAYRRAVGPVPLYLGLPPRRPGRPHDLEGRLADSFRDAVGVGSAEWIATGHAAGLMALESAISRIAAGSVEFCLVGGVDSYLAADTLEWIEENNQLHGGNNAYGFIPGEAAGFCLLCSEKTAENRHLSPLARITGAATSRETKLIKTDAVCVGTGLTEVFQKVFEDLPSAAEKIDYTVCDMNGEPYRADEYGFTIARLSHRFTDASAFVAPADCWGDVGAASGPLFMNLVVASGNRGQRKTGYSLLWTSSESGERCAAILQQVTDSIS